MGKIAPAIRRRRTTQPADGSGLSISQFAREVGEPPHVIRYYCRIGLLEPSHRSQNGYRLFDRRAVRRSIFIRRAQGLGFTLEEIAEIFRHAHSGKSPCPQVRSIIERRIPQVAEQLDGLVELHRSMTRAVARWRRLPDQVPSGDLICALIESELEPPKARRNRSTS
ncbi:MerR family transcriptional regulator [Tahibacter amnicola]|uniref:MerR family transcriptional regulator n=1 Tax=Tahibacter amnicola TaxID=2976241 RepID=A0ABY6B935_9GAMM|nr:MerR family transcriptional regulator [Tahibacter amnicola]UXI66067.1 MerR family transcriptional regulator [Tahibacter amnicola]